MLAAVFGDSISAHEYAGGLMCYGCFDVIKGLCSWDIGRSGTGPVVEIVG